MKSNIHRLGMILISLGIIFGLETLLKFQILYNLWPLILTNLGAGFISIFFKRERRDSIYLGIGVYIICFSILAFYCNFQTWEKLSVLWPSFIAFIGISYLFIYLFFARHPIYLFMIILFLSVSLVFFIVFSVNSKYWWIIFIFLGIAAFVTERKKQ